MAQYDLNLRDYWRVIRKRRFIVIFTTIALGIFSVLFSILWQPVPLYEAVASVKVEQRGSITGLYVQTLSWSQTDYMQTQATLIKSYYIMEAVAKDLRLIPSDLSSDDVRSNSEYQHVILNLRNSVETEQEGFSNIINIKVTSQEPLMAKRIANTTARVYKEQHAFNLNKISLETRVFIENQLNVVKQKLRNSEDAVRKYRERHKLIALSSQTSSLLNQMTSLQVAYEKSLKDFETVSMIERELERSKDSPLTSKNSFYINEASSLYKNLNDRLVQLMLNRDSLLLIYTEEFPQVVEINKQISEIVTNMRAQLSSQKTSLTATIQDLKNKINAIDRQIKILPEKGLELARLEQDVQINREVYTLLEKKYQEALIKESEKIEEVQIVKPALEPTSPINPPMTTATGAVGTFIGLIMGILFAFLVETFDTSVADIEEIEELTGVNVLGIIPHYTKQEIKTLIEDEVPHKTSDKDIDRYSAIVSHFAPQSTLAETYRTLRTNLSFSSIESDMKVIAVTSSSPKEGKTTIAANLAVTLAQAGNKTLLIDGDMRRPTIASIFGIDQVPGLSDVILGNYTPDESIRSTTDILMGGISMDELLLTPGMDNLSLFTSGTLPPNPAELVSSNRLAELIEQVRSQYDFVVIDAPPLLVAADSTVYGSLADGVVLVYRAGKIGRAILKRAKAQLDNVRATVSGIVLNGMKADISPDFVRHGYYKYYHYYSATDAAEPSKSFLRRFLSFIFPSAREGSAQNGARKSSPVKALVLIVTILLLVLAILYQSGYIGSSPLDIGSSIARYFIPATDTDTQRSQVRKPIDTRVRQSLWKGTTVVPDGGTARTSEEPADSERARLPSREETATSSRSPDTGQ